MGDLTIALQILATTNNDLLIDAAIGECRIFG